MPASPLDPFRYVSERVKLPLASGRGARPQVLRELVTGNLVDHLVLEVGRVGGLVEARRIAALAEVHHIGIVPIGSGSSVSLRAALQLAAVVTNLSVVEIRPGLAPIDRGMTSVDDRPDVVPVPSVSGVSSMSDSKSARRQLLEANVRTYFEGCNEGSHAKMASVFAPSIAHYFPPGMFGPRVGSESIAALWRGTIRQNGSRWTIDRMVSDENEVVIEWTHFQPNAGAYIRGAEWYEFDADGQITVIKAYYASPRDRSLPANELDGYPYAELGYPDGGPG